MIRRLRIQFICVIMAIVMLMLGIILGVVIHFTGKNLQTQSISMMRTLAANPLQPGDLEKPADEVRLPYFIVQVGSRGELLSTSGGYFDLSDQEYVLQIVNAAFAAGQEQGELEEYQLRFLMDRSPRGYTLIFADTTAETATLQTMIYSSLLIFVIACALFWGISVLLSRWVIRPVEAAWDQQRQFVADASHELKTPLSVIMANAELLQNSDTCETDRKRFSGSILSMTYQMRSLVENMLEMAQVDNGSVKMRFAEVDMSQLVQDAVLSVQLLYEEKGLTLSCQIPEGILLTGSEQHLYQVLDVLLDNAMKYSEEGAAVRVSLERSGKSCLLSVANPGPAISNEDLTNIFKRFYRADKARTMNGSYGLGLSIAQSIVTAHKGRIWAQSGGGINTFRVLLPLHHGK